MHSKIIPIRNSRGERSIQEQIMNIRRQRILEAMEKGAIPMHISIDETHDHLKLNRFEPLLKKLKSIYDAEQANEMKLKVLENWETTKRQAIERLAEDIEWLQAVEEKIEKREEKLAEAGKKINEAVFQKMCSEIFQRAMTPVVSPKPAVLQPNLFISTTSPTISPDQPQPPKKSAAPTPPLKKSSPQPAKVMHIFGDNDNDMVVIGPNGTTVSAMALNNINWSLSGAAVTRKILMEVFDRETLAFHTLTGKPSPAFMDCDKPLKHQLDPAKVADIIYIVTKYLDMSSKEVRSAITTKCADENKMFRQREKKRLSKQAPKAKKMKFNKEE